jgi:hypothetical protein
MARLLGLLVLLALAGCGGGGGGDDHRLVVGAVEDAAKWSPDPDATMRKAHDAGFRADVLSAVWQRGASPGAAAGDLRRAVEAAVAADVEPVLAVYQLSGATPLTAEERREYTQFAVGLVRRLPDVRTVIVGNEPNLNLFWQPQFGADGSDAAAPAYLRLLAETYDALKEEDADLTVVGGGLAPRGGDDPDAARQTQSPTAFIGDLGRAYRASGRTKPVMDAFSLHVYGETPRVPPTLRHPRTTSLGIADYPRLVRLLGTAFDGTAQQGSDLPIVYGEYGVETTVPARKRAAYEGDEVVATVDEATQARYYTRAIELTACQPTVSAIYLFHVIDEQPLTGLQSGLLYADGTPKSSLAPVRRAIERPRCVKVSGT